MRETACVSVVLPEKRQTDSGGFTTAPEYHYTINPKKYNYLILNGAHF